MSHDLDEALIGIRSALAGDSALTSLLGDATQIYREEEILKKVTYPILSLICPNDNPQFNLSGTGVWRPELEIGIQATKKSTCRAILAVLDSNWDIPRNRTAAITTDNFAVTLMKRTNAVSVGPIGLVNTDERIYLINTLWQLRIHKTT